jgi:NarL family two-component system sensor histidine kinase YdfH
MAVFVIVYVAMFNRQANARAHAQALLLELETAHRQLSEYATQIEDLTRSAERQRMARELHDTLAQGLAGLILQLEALQAFLERGDTHKAVLIAGQAEDRARAALAQSRQAIDDLRAQAPSALIEYIRAEAERFSAATGIPCTLRLTNMLPLSTTQQEHARRLVSEGLSNIARHARASHTSISLDALDGAALLQICDDGIGFEPAAVIGQAGHYGLLGLRERARLAGGKLEVVSAAGKGTTLNLKLPLETKS